MADSPPPPPPPPPAPTTITVLSDDILLEIFLRLPDITTLARAAFACRAFLHAVRSSPAFRRRFRQLHAPPLLALLLLPDMRVVVPAAAGKRSDIAGAFDGLLQDSDTSEWRSDPEIPYNVRYAHFFNRDTEQRARYNPYSQALSIYPKNFREGSDNDAFLELHTLAPDSEEKRPSRVICVHRDRAWEWARVAVFSSHTMEWQVLPDMETGILLPDSDRYATGTVINGFVCWVHSAHEAGFILALNTSTFQFFRMDLPPPLKVPVSMFQLGHTKDGEFCVVSVQQQCMLSVWLWAADGDGVERFLLHKSFSLRANVNEVTGLSEEAGIMMRPIAVINGFVYLCFSYFKESPQWFLSFCLETAEVNLLHNHKQNHFILFSADPYIMVSWPSSLIHGKDSETGVTENISEDNGPMGTEETFPVLFTALQSFKEKLIDADISNFAGIDSFLLDGERNSLLNRIATLESRLAAGRDRVLRIGTESESMEGMERVSCWQMCKGMLSRVCSRFFTG